jgi:trigger factor
MPDTDNYEPSEAVLNSDPSAAADDEEEAQRLALEVKVDTRSTCERHVTVAIPRDDIERCFDKEFTELMPKAHVAGFRPGRAPRKLVEARFRKDIAEKVKNELLMKSLTQVNEEQKLSAISEPEFDLEAVEMPDEGPLTFEFDIEVRPEFEVPKWKGLVIEKPVREFSKADIDQTLEGILARRGRLVPYEGAAESGDYVTTNLTFKYDDQVLASAQEEVIRIRPVLSFRDGKIERFDELMVGVRAGQTRQGEAQLGDDAPNIALRGQRVTAIFEVLEVKKLEMPEPTPELLDELGGFADEAELRDGIRDQLARQMEYEQHRRARQQITNALTVAADWELPPAMLQRQSHRELQRAVMELQRSGFSDEEIHAHENALRQNSAAATARALKEHFILERIAEEEKADATEEDYEAEIRLIAAQSGESARRVRARLDKSGSMDVLRNQIVERKVVERILAHATFKEIPYDLRRTDEEAIDHAAGGGEHADIPEAKYDEGEEVPEAKKNEERGTRSEERNH